MLTSPTSQHSTGTICFRAYISYAFDYISVNLVIIGIISLVCIPTKEYFVYKSDYFKSEQEISGSFDVTHKL